MGGCPWVFLPRGPTVLEETSGNFVGKVLEKDDVEQISECVLARYGISKALT